MSSDYVRVSRLFDADAEERAWAIWRERGHGHESFVACINAYVQDAAISASEPDVGKRDQWRPIETAPKDGSLVDLWTYWPEHDRWRREAGCGWVDGDWHNGTWAFHQYEQPPTASHWMPLPKPPTDDLIVGSDVGSTAPAE